MVVKFLFLFWIPLVSASPFPFLRNKGSVTNGEASSGQFPWEVAMITTGQEIPSFYFCTGSIISEQWILTIAECLVGAEHADVIVGHTFLQLDNYTTASQFILHDGYNLNSTLHNIGLIKLDEPLIFNDNVQAIALDSDEELGHGTSLTVNTWSVLDLTLIYFTVTTITNEECEKTYGNDSIFPDVVCATYTGETERTSCDIGDGSPVIIDASSKPVQVAIANFVNENGCENNLSPSKYTRIAFYRDWIREKTGI